MTAVPPSDLATQLLEAQAQIERMNRDGNALLQRNAELVEAAKHAAQAPRQLSHGAKPKPPSTPEFSGAHLKGYEVDAWLREMRKQFDHYGDSVFPDGAAMVRHAALFFAWRRNAPSLSACTRTPRWHHGPDASEAAA